MLLTPIICPLDTISKRIGQIIRVHAHQQALLGQKVRPKISATTGNRLPPSRELDATKRILLFVKVEEKFSVRIRVHSNLRGAHETFGDLVEGSDGSFHISIFNKQWFFRQVLAASGSIEILEPATWRQEILGAVGHLAAGYR
jgi:hypothetical protein